MKANEKQKRTLPDPEIIMRINRDGQFFKGLQLIFNLVLVLGLVLCCFWFLQ